VLFLLSVTQSKVFLEILQPKALVTQGLICIHISR